LSERQVFSTLVSRYSRYSALVSRYRLNGIMRLKLEEHQRPQHFNNPMTLP